MRRTPGTAPVLAVVALLLLPVLRAGGAQEASAGRRAPQVTVRISPETPAIGEPITVEIRVRAPLGSEIRFPALPDSAEAIEPLDPRGVRDASTAEWLDRTAVYRLIAWDTGARTVRFEDVRVAVAGAEQRYRVTTPPLRIYSVLPADSTGRIPRGPRALLDVSSGLWRLWVALAVIALLAFWVWRTRRRKVAAPPPAPDAARLAMDAFRHAGAIGLLEAGETGRFALTHVAVMRGYLAERFPQALPSLTAREVGAALVGAEFPILPERVVELLLRAEPIAFANAPIDAAGARSIADEAQAIVRDVETAWLARRTAVPKQGRRRAS